MRAILKCLMGVGLVAALVSCKGDRDTDRVAPDNTAVNERRGTTAEDQSNKGSDVDRTAEIRRAIVGEDSLSTNAKNVKIVTSGGRVTLTGPVASTTEKELVTRKAVEVAGKANVIVELSVTGDENPTPSALPRPE